MIDQVVLTGTGDRAGMGTIVDCSGTACSWASQQTWDFAFKWASGTLRSFTYTITNSGSGGTGVELKKYATLKGSYKINSELNPTPMVVTWANHYARCDSATYISGTGGCVHYSAIPVFTVSVSDSSVTQAADHWRDAIEQPSTTIPLVPGKVIPYELNRTRDQTIIDANRATARRTCNTDPAFQNINKTGKSCDEYPFATTLQGASRGPYSVRWIDATQNSTAGSRLASFYNYNRVLDGDNFFVAISD
jgi:Deoxyribonuclease NucA/NucB